MARYRKDSKKDQPDGSTQHFANWMGGPTLSAIDNCRTALGFRANVSITGEADTWFSIPAEFRFKGCRVRGYVTSDDDGLIFRHCYF